MFPPVTSFKIVIAGEEKEIRLRKVSLRDHLACHKVFGQEIVETLSILGGDVDNIARLIYMQIVEEDTFFFESKDATAVDEDGNKQTLKIGGAKLLAMYIGDEETFQVAMTAYQTCLLSGLPVVEKKKPLIKGKKK